jgi:hypothetical protein
MKATDLTEINQILRTGVVAKNEEDVYKSSKKQFKCSVEWAERILRMQHPPYLHLLLNDKTFQNKCRKTQPNLPLYYGNTSGVKDYVFLLDNNLLSKFKYNTTTLGYSLFIERMNASLDKPQYVPINGQMHTYHQVLYKYTKTEKERAEVLHAYIDASISMLGAVTKDEFFQQDDGFLQPNNGVYSVYYKQLFNDLQVDTVIAFIQSSSPYVRLFSKDIPVFAQAHLKISLSEAVEQGKPLKKRRRTQLKKL